MAAVTTRVRLGTAVYLLPLRHPVVVAKTFAGLDYISDGRLVFGVGVGGEYAKEFEATSVPVAERGSRTDEGPVDRGAPTHGALRRRVARLHGHAGPAA